MGDHASTRLPIVAAVSAGGHDAQRADVTGAAGGRAQPSLPTGLAIPAGLYMVAA